MGQISSWTADSNKDPSKKFPLNEVAVRTSTCTWLICLSEPRTDRSLIDHFSVLPPTLSSFSGAIDNQWVGFKNLNIDALRLVSVVTHAKNSLHFRILTDFVDDCPIVTNIWSNV